MLSFLHRPISIPPLPLVTEAHHRVLESNDDPSLRLLNQQLRGVSSSLVVCKWPMALTSCFFVTLLCWDMAGDKGGWSQALWVPIVGMAMAMAIRVWDLIVLSPWSHLHILFWSWCSLDHPQHSDPDPPSLPICAVGSVEFVCSSLPQFDSSGSQAEVALDVNEGSE
jgi:hypothetical protein